MFPSLLPPPPIHSPSYFSPFKNIDLLSRSQQYQKAGEVSKSSQGLWISPKVDLKLPSKVFPYRTLSSPTPLHPKAKGVPTNLSSNSSDTTLEFKKMIRLVHRFGYYSSCFQDLLFPRVFPSPLLPFLLLHLYIYSYLVLSCRSTSVI